MNRVKIKGGKSINIPKRMYFFLNMNTYMQDKKNIYDYTCIYIY